MASNLNTRREVARGFNKRLAKIWGNRRFAPTSAGRLGNHADLTTSLTGTNNDLYIFSRTPGTGGNAITFRIVVAGASTPLSVSVTGSAITVNAATDGSSAVISTAKDIHRAVNNDRIAGPLVWVQNAPGNDGSGIVTALAATSLSGAS